ncbi:hypothetical protein V6259_12485 [Marinomonas sp. TI.3.20]|uniref:hypothetical protein n=1 Tax=Marinomonas sp. TI.3.20 TaxID=3121296 RepID=UPI00311EFE72
MADVMVSISASYLTLLFIWFYAGGTWLFYTGIDKKIKEQDGQMMQQQTQSIGSVFFNSGWAMFLPAILVMISADLGFDNPFYLFTQVAYNSVSIGSKDVWGTMCAVSAILWATLAYMATSTNYEGVGKMIHSVMLLAINQALISFYATIIGTATTS